MSNFSGVRVARSLILRVCFVDCCLSFCTFSFGHCVFCPLQILITLWYLQIQTLLKPLIVDLYKNNIKYNYVTVEDNGHNNIYLWWVWYDRISIYHHIKVITSYFYLEFVDYNTYRQWIINMGYIFLLSYYVHWLWNQSHHT